MLRILSVVSLCLAERPDGQLTVIFMIKICFCWNFYILFYFLFFFYDVFKLLNNRTFVDVITTLIATIIPEKKSHRPW